MVIVVNITIYAVKLWCFLGPYDTALYPDGYCCVLIK